MPVDNPAMIPQILLGWYDRHRRHLPWRAGPGDPAPDPYAVWMSEIMLQQTTVAAVKPYFAAFMARWPTVEALAAADEADVMTAWAGLGYYARARNLIACARTVAHDHGGRFPDNEVDLRALPGLGDYTAAAVAAIAFGRRAVVVDANVARVTARLFALETPLPAGKAELYRLADSITPDDRAGDFAQAMMDLGSGVCTTRSPQCLICPLAESCIGRRLGTPESFPLKAPKTPKPHRFGTAFWIERGDHVLLIRRPDKGLLGGMRALPSNDWATTDPALCGAPIAAAWRDLGTVPHVFTHFSLDLRVMGTTATGDTMPDGEWWPIAEIGNAGLPTLFARAASRAIAASESIQESG
jgi:A/G-specific adenine glycosylase